MVIVERHAVERRNGQDGGRPSVLLIDDVIAPVDVERIAGNELRGVVREERHRQPDVHDADELAGGRLLTPDRPLSPQS
jgi:hypothetical protein